MSGIYKGCSKALEACKKAGSRFERRFLRDLTLCGCFCLLLSSCYNIPEKPMDLQIDIPAKPLPPLELPEKKEIPKYIYEGMRYQDPFIQLDKSDIVVVQSSQVKNSIDPSILIFKGVIKQEGKAIALLVDTAGNTYFVKNMRLVDMKGRVIPGVVGIVQDESIIIETEDNVSREIKLYE